MSIIVVNRDDNEFTILVVAGLRSLLLVLPDGGLMKLCSAQIRFKLRLNLCLAPGIALWLLSSIFVQMKIDTRSGNSSKLGGDPFIHWRTHQKAQLAQEKASGQFRKMGAAQTKPNNSFC
jgi:hypothetical protein